MIVRALPVALLALAAALPPAVAAADGLPGKHPVTSRLLADVSAVEPGESFRLGVELKMESGWHTYWQNSGDAGYPTKIIWQLPEGIVAGALQWPGPHKYQEQEELVVYGYADETVLVTEFSVDADLGRATSPVTLGAKVEWLVCREICIPGSASLTVDLPIGPQVSPSTDLALIERFQSMVPTPLAATDPYEVILISYPVGLGGETYARLQLRRTGSRASESGSGSGAVGLNGDSFPDFFPTSIVDGNSYPGRRRGVIDGGVIVDVVISDGGAEISEVEGVLAFEGTDGFARYRSLSIELPPQQSLGLILALAIAGGLILNLMPCVLPVISLKVLSFLSQAGERRGRMRSIGLIFSAGVITTFILLALVVTLLKAGGEQIGWGFQFQSPAFVLFLTALVFVLGLSLFGVVTVRLPGAAGSSMGASQGESLTASFLNGVLATVLATPCTAPFLGTALGFAFSQE